MIFYVKVNKHGQVNVYEVKAKKLPKINNDRIYTLEELQDELKYYPGVKCRILVKDGIWTNLLNIKMSDCWANFEY